MQAFRLGSRRVAQLPRSAAALPATLARRSYASRIDIPFAPPPVPTIESCPAPTCQCRETPPGLDIEREQGINGSMPTYAEQVLISTGKDDWTSRIEDDEGSALVRQIKNFLGRNGKYSDPYHNVMLTNSSFPPTPTAAHQTDRATQTKTSSIPAGGPGKDPSIVPQDAPDAPPASAFLFPSFQYLPNIPVESTAVEAFLKGFVLPSRLHQQHDSLTRAQKNILLRSPEIQRQFPGARKVDEIMILICGHGGRDERCGKLGPILRDEFEEKLQRQNIPLLKEAPVAEAEEIKTEVVGYTPTARVGLISHIGGHKWAGNVIIYIPPSFSDNSLAGKGIWYGRVGPEHVEGIVEKTVLGGKVIKDLFRGGIGQDSEIIRILGQQSMAV